MLFSEKVRNEIKSAYTTEVVTNFYNPVLGEAELYQRVSGYYSTLSMDLYVEGIEKLATNNGIIELIISKDISEEDYEKIQRGYKLFHDRETIIGYNKDAEISPEIQNELGNLAFMIAMGKARVKIGFSDKGLFHDKFGIIKKGEESVLFVGSMNETKGGLHTNYESISVDVSWDKSYRVADRIKLYNDRFARLWNNQESGTTVIEASDLAYKQLARYQTESNLTPNEIEEDVFNDDGILDNTIRFIYSDDHIVRLDNSVENITNSDRKLRIGSDLTEFFHDDNITIKAGTNYINIERVIDVTKARCKRKNIKVYVSNSVLEFIARNKYSIEQYKIIGDVYQNEITNFPDSKIKDYYEFCSVVQREVSRPLLELHLRASFYKYEMSKAANFSVPGAGKTAMILGVFAFLNRLNNPRHEYVERILVICPISAINSWEIEFGKVFGNKKRLKSIDSQSSQNFEEDLNLNWNISNLVIINYESLPRYEALLSNLIDAKTMLVFDEVHRIKNPEGVRALSALNISRFPKFKYVLSGTPIPNSYTDIYNFLQMLYCDEYSSFFGWDLSTLKEPKVREIMDINKRIYPFFWRTNKNDLNVPKADVDVLKIVAASDEQLELVKAIYQNEKNGLARLIRLMQASTNPSLINKKIDFNELLGYDENGDIEGISKQFLESLYNPELENDYNNSDYSSFDLPNMIAPKFELGIELILNLVKENKKVLVWGLYVDTLEKITMVLRDRGIKVNLIYGATDKSIRVDLLNEFKYGEVEVLVSNPQTLGESISLHHEVHDAVYFEYNFNLTFMLQSRDRIHRLGLSPDQYTKYYYVQTKDELSTSSRPGFIDEKIYNRLKEKERIMYDAIDSNELFVEYNENEILQAIEIIDEERLRIRVNSK